MNYIKLLFSLMTTGIILVGSLINTLEKYLPVFIKQTFRYGKFAYKGNGCVIKPVQVPKSWFRHFYIFSSAVMSFALIVVINVYVFNNPPPSWLTQLLNYCCGYTRQATTTKANVILAFILLNVQCWRRLYDTHFVSVFADSSHMDLTHYIVGFTHYFGTAVAILAEAPQFTYAPIYYKSDVYFKDVIASTIFLWACYHQYKTTVILGNLRRDKKGDIVTNSYKLPRGDWFNYLSSPHLIAEILMYFSLTILLYHNETWWFIFVWVLSNQVETALLSHWWYESTFLNFPKNRKALIPYVY